MLTKHKLRKLLPEARAQYEAYMAQHPPISLPNIPASVDVTTERPSFQLVHVVNRNTFEIVDRWDGVPFRFLPEPGDGSETAAAKGMNIPPDVAAHLFGWPGEPDFMRLYIAKRHGWNTPEAIARDPATGKMKWEQWVDNIIINNVHFDLVPRDPAAPIPADTGPDEEEELMREGDIPIPVALDAEVTTTHGGKRNRQTAPRRTPRRVDV
jgi:hypothetical protein